MTPEPLAVYVHCPFCPSKCGYCDFNSYAMDGAIRSRTAAAMVQEIKRSPIAGRPAKTIFFGGGTPTYFEAGELLAIFEAVLEVHPPVDGCEITSESNPGTADASKYDLMRRAGFNRLSLGAQSFQRDELVRLNRVHSPADVERAVQLARKAGFENLNLDLMFALPGQSSRVWESNLRRAIELGPEHLSLYCLTIEPNTAFYKEHVRGVLDQPNDEAQVTMYDQAVALAEEAGYELYEISNYAKPGRECRHNLCYWHGEEYAGYGPGAVGTVEKPGKRMRRTVTKHPVRYCEQIEAGDSPYCEEESLDEEARRLERVMLGIRLREGIPTRLVDESALGRLRNRGWIEVVDERVRLTAAGRHFCSEVALELA